jgi:hypothetical protein
MHGHMNVKNTYMLTYDPAVKRNSAKVLVFVTVPCLLIKRTMNAGYDIFKSLLHMARGNMVQHQCTQNHNYYSECVQTHTHIILHMPSGK